MNSELRIVIIAQFGPPALTAIRSWGRRGAQVGLVQIVSSGEPVARSRYLTDSIAMTADEFLQDEGLTAALTFIRDFKATKLLVVNEQLAIHLDENVQRLPDDLQLMFSSAESTRAILSKSQQNAMAVKLGMNLLPTWEITDRDFNLTAIGLGDYPLCLRPAVPGGVLPPFKVEIVRSSAELSTFITGIEEFHGPLLAQPFTNVPNLVVHGVRSQEGLSVGVEGFLVAHKFQGLTMSITPFPLTDDLRQKCIAFVDSFGVIGPYHFEFLYDPATNTPWFLELNSRLGGTTAKVLACGYDEPAWALKAFGYDVDTGRIRDGITASSKKALIRFLLAALMNKLTPLDYPDDPRWRRILTALNGLLFWRDDVFAGDDLRGTLALYGLLPGKGRL